MEVEGSPTLENTGIGGIFDREARIQGIQNHLPKASKSLLGTDSTGWFRAILCDYTTLDHNQVLHLFWWTQRIQRVEAQACPKFRYPQPVGALTIATVQTTTGSPLEGNTPCNHQADEKASASQRGDLSPPREHPGGRGQKGGEHPKTIYSGQFSEVFCGVKWFWFRVRRCGES